MKILNLIVGFLTLILIGCSTIYRVSDFASKEKYYEDFNNFASNKHLKITLKNDSSFITQKGTKISNESVILLYGYQSNTFDIIPKQDINKVINFYDENSNQTIKILLKNGNEINEKDIGYLPDSSIKIAVTKIINFDKSIPLTNVKEISYNRHWLGIIPGFFAGIPIGAFLAEAKLIPSSHTDGNSNVATYDYINATLIGIPVGIIIGSTVGWFIGYTYTYQFNP
jgi:hypothetical protein